MDSRFIELLKQDIAKWGGGQGRGRIVALRAGGGPDDMDRTSGPLQEQCESNASAARSDCEPRVFLDSGKGSINALQLSSPKGVTVGYIATQFFP